MKKRILITGSRGWVDRRVIRQALQQLDPAVHLIVHGAALGADSIADEEARKLLFEREPHPVPREVWRERGGIAGPERNLAMVESGIDGLFAFRVNMSDGTSSTVEMCRARLIPRVIYDYDTKTRTLRRTVELKGERLDGSKEGSIYATGKWAGKVGPLRGLRKPGVTELS